MPNWIINKIKLNGEKENIEKLLSMITENEAIDFDKIIPMPKTQKECDPKYYVNENSHVELMKDRPWFDWYEWSCDNWGTKWNACDSGIQDDDTIYFQTA